MNDELKSKLTAWALDELTPDERAATEARIESAPEARDYAHKTREFCHLLATTLTPETDAALTAGQRAELARQFSAAPAEKVVRFRPASLAWIAGIGAVAAALALWSGRFLSGPWGEVVLQTAPDSSTQPVTPADEFLKWDMTVRDREGVEWGDLVAQEAKDATKNPAADAGLGEAEGLAQSSMSKDLGRFGGLPPAPSESAREQTSATSAPTPDPRAKARPMLTQPSTESLRTELAQAPPSANDFFDSRARNLGDLDAGVRLTDSEPAGAAAGPEAQGRTDRPADALAMGFEQAASTSLATANQPAPGNPGEAPTTTPSDPAAPTTRAARGAADTRRGLIPRPDGKSAPDDGLTRLNQLEESLADSTTDGHSSVEGLAFKEAEARSSLARLHSGADGNAPSAAGVPVTPSTPAALSAIVPKEEKAKSLYETRFSRYYLEAAPPAQEATAETYAAVPENPFKPVPTDNLSTFSIDVDTASYANVRRFLNQGQRPPQAAIRLEEIVNYFRYDYAQPEAATPFSVTVDIAECPWQPAHRLARIGLKGREIAAAQRPQSNLVFLIDVSGSMNEPNKLPLVQQSLHLLSSQLGDKDRVAMVTYAGNSGLALDSTTGADRAKIGGAIDRLAAGGSTNGASGIQLAYDVAGQNFIKEGVNRVLLATDGDFNVGVTSKDALEKLITDRAKGGVFLSVLGYGMGNLKDSTMEMLADKGNGNYAYIDSLGEARKVLGEEMSSTLVTIAKDVKIQVDFNPHHVRSYRLLGYENRALAREDFNNDSKDAGEIGAGHTVTALYELVPVGAPPDVPPVDPSRYDVPVPAQRATGTVPALDPAIARETMTVKLRYKEPDGTASRLIEVPVVDKEMRFVEAPADFKFAASVTLFGMLLKDSAHKGNGSWDHVRQLAIEGKGPDPLGYRGEFIQLVEKARGLAP